MAFNAAASLLNTGMHPQAPGPASLPTPKSVGMPAAQPSPQPFNAAQHVAKQKPFTAPANDSILGNVGAARKLEGIYQNAGLTKQGASALIGNQSVESAGLHSNLWQFGSSPSQHVLGQGTAGYGYAQWTDPSRQLGLKNYAQSHGEKVGTAKAQAGFTLQELQSRPGLFNALKTGHNTAALATAVQNDYEQPHSRTESLGQRIDRAKAAASTNWALNGGGKATPAPSISEPAQGRGSRLEYGTKSVTEEVPTTQNEKTAYMQNIARQTVEQFGSSDFSENFVKSMAANPPPQMKKAQVQIGTTTRVPDPQQSNNLMAAAGAAARGQAGNPANKEWNTVVKSANFINSKHFNYEWGGGHNSTFTPTNGGGAEGSGPGVGYDCSGVLSRILHTAGLLNQPLTSGQFADLPRYVASAKPGPAPANDPHAITIYANSVHTFAKIGNQYFGTSVTNPGGGAGYMTGKAGTDAIAYLASLGGYQTVHINL